MTGFRTNVHTKEVREVPLKGIIQNGWFKLIGGPTGFESVELTPDNVDKLGKMGWLACFGTKGKWDKLFVPADQMKNVFRQLEMSVANE